MASSGAHDAWTIDNWGDGYDLINGVSGFAPLRASWYDSAGAGTYVFEWTDDVLMTS
jgi:hypothetical protein